MIYVNLKEYCEQNGRAERTIRRMCSAGMIVAEKRNGKWLVGLDIVQKFADDEDYCYECDDFNDCPGDVCSKSPEPVDMSSAGALEVDVPAPKYDPCDVAFPAEVESEVEVVIPIKFKVKLSSFNIGD